MEFDAAETDVLSQEDGQADRQYFFLRPLHIQTIFRKGLHLLRKDLPTTVCYSFL